MMEAVNMGKNPLDQTMVSNRSMGAGNTAVISPQRIIADLVSGVSASGSRICTST
jgi:hypothetical protein